MKNLRNLIIVSLIITSFSFIKCTKEKSDIVDNITIVNNINIDTISFSHSMKGWELYSWQNGNDWNYSILMGTNRQKSYEEVTTNPIIVSGKDSLKMVLNKLPENEEIFWIGGEWLERCWGDNNYENLSLPNDNTINEIVNYSTQKGLVLSVNN